MTVLFHISPFVSFNLCACKGHWKGQTRCFTTDSGADRQTGNLAVVLWIRCSLINSRNRLCSLCVSSLVHHIWLTGQKYSETFFCFPKRFYERECVSQVTVIIFSETVLDSHVWTGHCLIDEIKCCGFTLKKNNYLKLQSWLRKNTTK